MNKTLTFILLIYSVIHMMEWTPQKDKFAATYATYNHSLPSCIALHCNATFFCLILHLFDAGFYIKYRLFICSVLYKGMF